NNYLVNFWGNGFMPLPPWSDWGWFSRSFNWVLADGIGLPSTGAILLLAVGIISIWLRRWEIGAMLLLSIVFTLIASGLHKYPFADRLVLFIIPIFSLFLAEAIGTIRSLFDRVGLSLMLGLPVAIGVLISVAMVPAWKAVHHVWQPRLGEEIKP